jgi:transposase InsO family protein
VDRELAGQLIREAVGAGARLWKACEVLEITVRTYQRWGKSCAEGDGRHGPRGRPANSLSTEERAELVAIATSERFRELAPSQIVPILAEEGVYVASESSFYRVLRREKLLAHRSRSRAAAHHRPMEYVAKGPNELWSWDITYLRGPVRGQFLYLYLVVDVWSRMIVAWEVAEEESSEIASQMIVRACRERGVDSNRLVVHSDNGGPMKGATLLATFQFLGIVPSFSRPRVSDDNPYSEALFRTLKYRPEYPGQAFESLAAAREWVQRFVRWYNNDHRHSGIKFVSPSARHEGREAQILCTRRSTYEQARRRHPNRWSRGTRNWSAVQQVVLNPQRGNERVREQISAHGAGFDQAG